MNTNEHAAVAADEATHDEFGGRIYSLRHIAAFGAYTAAGWSLQDLSAAHLEALLEDKHFADEVRAERKRRMKAAAPTPPAVSRPAGAQGRHGMTAADYATLGKVLGPILREYVTKRLEEAQPNTEIEARLARLDSLIILYEGRLKNLEANTTARGLSWAGEHASGHAYTVGEIVKHRGGVWLAAKDTEASPGSSPDEWQLIVKGQAYSS